MAMKILVCPVCKKEFVSPWVTKPQKHCSRKCYLSTLKGKPKSEQGRKNIADGVKKAKAWLIGIPIRRKLWKEHPELKAEWARKKGETASGKNHWHWKGNNIKYYSIHAYILKHFIKSGICEHCNKEAKTDWANKDGKYNREDRNNWIELCRSCHKKYDYKFKIKRKYL